MINKNREAAISKRLKERAGILGITAAQLGAETGTPTPMMLDYLSTGAVPLWLIPEICEQLQIHPWTLLTGQPELFSPPFHVACQNCTGARRAALRYSIGSEPGKLQNRRLVGVRKALE